MNTRHEPTDHADTLQQLLAAALAADVQPARLEALIRHARRPQPGLCPECSSTMRLAGPSLLRCTNCGVTSSLK